MATDPNLRDPDLRGRAVMAARGLKPFDLLVENARVPDMITGRERRADIGIIGALIASVHDPDGSLDAERRLDAGGAFVLPGLIDTHMHVESSMVTPGAYAAAALPKGVTTAVWDPHEFANACGGGGVAYALKAAEAAALRFLVLAPTCVPSAPGYENSGADFDAETIAGLLAREDVHGAAELMTMKPLLDGDMRVTGIVQASVASGKRVCGHGRGLGNGDLAAYAAAGIETDHELTSARDLIAKLEAGLTIELRGSHEHLLPEFARTLVDLGHLPQTVTLCTDDVFPDHLIYNGALDHVIRLLIEAGLPVEWAYRAATLNAASRIGRRDLGLIAPGKRADLILVSDLTAVKVEVVIVNGRMVAASGAFPDPPQETPCSTELLRTVKAQVVSEEEFEVSAKGPRARIAVLSKPRFPEWGERVVEVENGVLSLPADMVRMAVVNRYGRYTPVRVAFLEGWGKWRGAFATTVSHDSHNLTVFGREPEDMAVAANTVRAMGGGIAVVRSGEAVARLELPIAGLISGDTLEEVAAGFEAVRSKIGGLVDWEPPYLVFKALFGASLVCNPGPRLSDVGLVDPFAGRMLERCVIADGVEAAGS